jgi:predicted RNA-binding protein Jag
MVYWIDNIAFGVDFRSYRKQKPETLERLAAQIIDFRKHREHKPETLEQMAEQIFDGINLPDTAPCEMIPYLAPAEDLA